tara:strand:- start:2939 stop:4078 length:1140 start_codon:yes stop_codon:yes gene_type:complete
MNFKNSREGALAELNSFTDNEISNYSRDRNFDYGPENRKNVSMLSPYITHRLITEYEVVKKVLRKFPYQKVEKYIQEIFWRIYWKGWLELRPDVWSDFLDDLKKINEDKNYLQAINGETEIECFNDWVRELKKYNYLHNHTRMWFASIWIFSLKLPWQKGAEFFMRYLLDGDAASNTLSWRWVAGLQTKGKHYLAQSWNIKKFTNEKYNNIKLNENVMPIVENKDYKLSKINIAKRNVPSDTLIFFENDLSIENYKLHDYKRIFFILLNNNQRQIKIDEKVLKFKMEVMKDQINRFHKNATISDGTNNKNLFNEGEKIDVIYPSIGENMSFLEVFYKKKNLDISFLTRPEDEYCWQFSNKGYFNFKSNIPKIIAKLNLS